MITHVYQNRNAIQNHRGKLIELTEENVEEIAREIFNTELAVEMLYIRLNDHPSKVLRQQIYNRISNLKVGEKQCQRLK